MTYSIVALDSATGDLGVAVQSKFLAVGSVVPWAQAGIGAVATQSFANVAYGPDGLALLAGGASAQETLDRLIAGDASRDERQAGIVDARGRGATYTGRACFGWAGGRTGPGFAAQGNILAGAGVVDGLADTFLSGDDPFPERLVRCLVAADAAGGDRRGRESAALLVVRADGGYAGGNDRWIDLRVDGHDDPIAELERLLGLHRLYMDRPQAHDLLPLDELLARDIRRMLERVGAGPGGWTTTVYQRIEPSGTATEVKPERPAVGAPRSLPDGWDATWQQALLDWMSVENLEERVATTGWVDPRVVDVLRSRAV